MPKNKKKSKKEPLAKASKNSSQTGKKNVSSQKPKVRATAVKRTPANLIMVEHNPEVDYDRLREVAVSFVSFAWNSTPKNTLLQNASTNPNWAEESFAAIVYDLSLAIRGEKSVFKEVPQIYDDVRSALMPKTVNVNGCRHSFKFVAVEGAVYPFTSPPTATSTLPFFAAPVGTLAGVPGVKTCVSVLVPADPSESIYTCNNVVWNGFKLAGHKWHVYGTTPASPLMEDASAFAVVMPRPTESDFRDGNTTAFNEVQAPSGGVTRWLAALRLAVYSQDRANVFPVDIDYGPTQWVGNRILNGHTGNTGRKDTLVLKLFDVVELFNMIGTAFNIVPDLAQTAGLDLSLQTVPGQSLDTSMVIRVILHAAQTFFLPHFCVFANIGLSSAASTMTNLPMAGQFQPPNAELTGMIKLFQPIVETLRMMAPVSTEGAHGGMTHIYPVPVAKETAFFYYPTPTAANPEFGWVDPVFPLPYDPWTLTDGAGLVLNNNSFGSDGSTMKDAFDGVVFQLNKAATYCTLVPTFNSVNRNGVLTALTRITSTALNPATPAPKSVSFGNSKGGSWRLDYVISGAPLRTIGPISPPAEKTAGGMRHMKDLKNVGGRNGSLVESDPFTVAIMSSATTLSPEMMLLSSLPIPEVRLFNSFTSSSNLANLLAYKATTLAARSYEGNPNFNYVSDIITNSMRANMKPPNYNGIPTEMTAFFKKATAHGDGGLIQMGSTAFANMLHKKGKIGEKAVKDTERISGIVEKVFNLII